MNLFNKLQMKYLLIPLIIMGSLLLITFSTIFGITYTTTTNEVEKTIATGHPKIVDSNVPTSGKFIYIKSDNGTLSSTYDEDAVKEMYNIIDGEENGKFSYDGRYYAYTSIHSEEDSSIILYTILDWTEQRNTVMTLGVSLLTVFLISLVIIAGLSYILAYSATQPVKDAFDKERDLLANASHELKTPITVAKTNLDLVLSDPYSTVRDNQKWLEGAKYQIDRMNSLILQMLELSRLERHDYIVEKTDVNISDLIEGILLSCEAGCYENNIRFVSSLQPDVFFRCNRVETEKLITILVDNAIKYTPKGGEICVTLAKTLKNISIKVTNTGEGIPPEQIDRIFDRFYKLDEAHKEAGKSFGLGLSIAKLISKSMGGDVTCFSEVGRYTTFEITLPLR